MAAYTDLLRQAYAAIKSLDGFATVITGGSSPAGGAVGSTFVSPVNWLRNGIYANGGQGSFGTIGARPYTGVPYGPSTIAPWNPFQQTVDLHNIMVAHGDGGKKVWGTEAGAFTGAAARAVTYRHAGRFRHPVSAGLEPVAVRSSSSSITPCGISGPTPGTPSRTTGSSTTTGGPSRPGTPSPATSPAGDRAAGVSPWAVPSGQTPKKYWSDPMRATICWSRAPCCSWPTQ